MSTISIRIGHDDNSVVITILNFKIVTYTSTDCMNNRVNFLILNISSKRAFSVLITLPRSGKIAWNLRSRPNLAEPPAESPSTKYNSFFSVFLLCAGVSFPDNNVSLRLFFYQNGHHRGPCELLHVLAVL